MGMSMLDFLNKMAESRRLTKSKFGEIMHSDEYTEEQRQEALERMELAGGYDNLED